MSEAPAALRFASQLEDARSCPGTANKPAKGPVTKALASSHFLLNMTEAGVDRAQHPLDVYVPSGVITLNTCY